MTNFLLIIIGIEVLFKTEEERWPSLNPKITAIVAAIFLICIFLLLWIKYYYQKKEKKIKNEHLFLINSNKKELSNHQYKILKEIVDTIKIKNANKIFTDPPLLLERSICLFLSNLTKTLTDINQIKSVCQDLIIIYQKIFNPSSYRKPIQTVVEIESGLLVALFSQTDDICIAKIISNIEGKIYLKLLWKTPLSFPTNTAMLYFWRCGDGEYTTTLSNIQIIDDTLIANLSSRLNRGKEVHIPYIVVMIPCQISFMATPYSQEQKESITEEKTLSGIIHQLNETGAIVCLTQKIDYGNIYFIRFTINDFILVFECKVLSEKYIHDPTSYYVTFRFMEGSDVAHTVLKQYLSGSRTES